MEALGPLTRVAPLEFAGRRLPLTLPTWGVRLRDDGRVTRYLLPGEPDLSRARPPWRYVEQMGAAHRLLADGARLTIITRKRGPVLTELKLVLDADVPRDPALEPRMGSPDRS